MNLAVSVKLSRNGQKLPSSMSFYVDCHLKVWSRFRVYHLTSNDTMKKILTTKWFNKRIKLFPNLNLWRKIVLFLKKKKPKNVYLWCVKCFLPWKWYFPYIVSRLNYRNLHRQLYYFSFLWDTILLRLWTYGNPIPAGTHCYICFTVIIFY